MRVNRYGFGGALSKAVLGDDDDDVDSHTITALESQGETPIPEPKYDFISESPTFVSSFSLIAAYNHFFINIFIDACNSNEENKLIDNTVA